MKKDKKNKPGSILLLTLLVLSFVIVIVLGGASMALSGIQMASIQSHSTKAYYAAEAGAEELLYRVRISQEIDLTTSLGEVISDTIINSSGATYSVNFTEASHQVGFSENVFTSLGSFLKTRRSVDIRF